MSDWPDRRLRPIIPNDPESSGPIPTEADLDALEKIAADATGETFTQEFHDSAYDMRLFREAFNPQAMAPVLSLAREGLRGRQTGERVGLRKLLQQVMEQAENDLTAAYEEICKLQGLDPKTHSWPAWSSPANTIRWFAEIRENAVDFPKSGDRKVAEPSDAEWEKWGQENNLSVVPEGYVFLPIEPTNTTIHTVAAALDHPSIFMGGPSQQNQRMARRLYHILVAAFNPEAMKSLLSLAREGLRARQAGEWRPTHRHKKRGSLEQVIGHASLQNATGRILAEADELVIYRDDEGRWWARHIEEFNDGRFEPVAAAPPAPGGK